MAHSDDKWISVSPDGARINALFNHLVAVQDVLESKHVREAEHADHFELLSVMKTSVTGCVM